MSNLTLAPPSRQARTCRYCGERPVQYRDYCRRCYDRRVKPPPPSRVEKCRNCGKTRSVRRWGLCYACYYAPGVLPRFSRRAKKAAEKEVRDGEAFARHVAPLAAVFLKHVHPRIVKVAGFHFRCCQPEDRDEMIAEAVALGWKFFGRTVLNGKFDPLDRVELIARYAVKHVRHYRLITGSTNLRDVLSRRYWARSGAEWLDRDVEDIPSHYRPEDEQPKFEARVRPWVRELSPLEREIVAYLRDGHSHSEARRHFGMTPTGWGCYLHSIADAWVRLGPCDPEGEMSPGLRYFYRLY